MVTVMVIHQSTGTLNKGERVAIEIDGFSASGVTKEQLTDFKGEAYFPDVDRGNGRIFVNGRTAYTGRFEGLVIVYA